MPYLNLDRRFVQRRKYDQEELLRSDLNGRKLSWGEVLASRYAIIVAPANFGKTTELKEQAKSERAAGKYAVFIELRKVLDRGAFEDSLIPSEVDAFEAWQQVPDAPVTLFIDSLDEASPKQRADLHHALKKVLKAVQWPNSNTQWIISTRPAVLSQDVLSQLSEILDVPLEVTSKEEADLGGLFDDEANKAITTRLSSSQAALSIFSLASLTSTQAKTYLQRVQGVDDAATLLEVAHNKGLPGFTKSPGGLAILAHLDLANRQPECLTDVYKGVVQAVELQQGRDDRLSTAGTPSAQVAVVSRIAAASMVCQRINIEMPSEQFGVDDAVLSARLIAGTQLSESGLQQLLTSQLFIDAGHHQVKLYPEELVPFLAAQHFASRVQSPEDAKRLVDAFSWDAPTGERGVQRRLLPILGWLATLSAYCRAELLPRDPQVVAFFGDLRNRDIPMADAHEAIRRSIQLVATQGDRLGRKHYDLTPENYWQVGADCNLPLISELFEQYGSNHRARSALINIATYSQSDILRQQVLKACQCDLALLMKQRQGLDLYYLLDLGVNEDLQGIATALMEETDLHESLISASIIRLAWSHLTVAQIVTLVERQFDRGQGAYRLTSTITGPVLDAADDQQAYKLARSLVIRLVRDRHLPDARKKVYSDFSDRRISFVIDVLASLITRLGIRYEARVVLLCLIIRRFFRECFYGSSDFSALRTALGQNPAVRLELLRKILQLTVPNAELLMQAIFGFGFICEPTLEDATTLMSDPLRSAILKSQANTTAGKKPRPTAKEIRQSRLTMDATSLATLHKEIELIRDGSGRQTIAWLVSWLLQANTSSRYSDVSIEPVAAVAGADLATAFKAGLSTLWRDQLPMFKEDEPRSTYHITVAGLLGLCQELRDGTDLPTLSGSQVGQAIQYACFEINGFPKWFWPLVDAHQAVAIVELQQLIARADRGPTSFEHAEELLVELKNAPESIQTALAPAAWSFLLKQPRCRNHTTESLLNLVSNVPGTTTQDVIEAQASSRLQATFSTAMLTESGESVIQPALLETVAQSVMWGAFWLTTHPDSFKSHLERWLVDARPQAQSFVFELAAYLGKDYGSKVIGLAKQSDDGVDTLAALYRWTFGIVRPENDIEHPEGSVYTPGNRDAAEQLRDALIPAIAAAGSTRAYEALEAIRKVAGDEQVQYLSSVLFDMQEARFSRSPVLQRDFDKFDDDFRQPVAGTLSLALAVQEDLLAVKYSIEKGEFSLRRFFSAVNFSRISTDKEGLALEADFQALLGSEMNHLAGARYTVTRESETAEATRRDVLCRKGSDYASIELKMSMRWTVPQYLEALEHQLVGQYMRNRNATTGFLVIVLQEKDRKWHYPTGSDRMTFSELIKLLQTRALELEGQDRRRFIRVIGIDATPPRSFRDA
ncbi:hypothetical protein PMI27_001001 [Pseudomonas sp. GM41(2012)]|uniref:hypothetical protein n=2 Tax=unclassified Pseudomonas TaxID=196821 RepID=UPI0002702267|nr:hypothetical protein [Pseudomonas sp. GM41(2012)]EUB74825.1 hypothetical protein PMI27_001001 [Pseudomonas sp. GM41(2012)]